MFNHFSFLDWKNIVNRKWCGFIKEKEPLVVWFFMVFISYGLIKLINGTGKLTYNTVIQNVADVSASFNLCKFNSVF